MQDRWSFEQGQLEEPLVVVQALRGGGAVVQALSGPPTEQ